MKDLFASAALVFAVVLAAPASDAPLEIGDGTCRLRVAGAEAEILGSGGQSLMRLTGLKGCWSDFETDGGTAVRAGADQIRMDYRIKGAEAARVALSAAFTCRSNRVTAVYDLTAPADVKIGGAMIRRQSPCRDSRLLKAGLWQRHAGGGEAVETNDGVFRRYDAGADALLEEIRGNPNWVSESGQHAAFVPAAETNRFRAEATFTVLPSPLSDAAAAAAFHGRPLAVELSTDRPFNLATDGVTPLALTALISNVRPVGVDHATVRLAVLDFDGKIVGEQRQRLVLPAGGQTRLTMPVPPVTGVYFAEAAVTDRGEEFFARTSLGAVAPYTFEHREQSIFGIAAAFDLPSRQDVNSLLRRMGVRWVRRGDSRETLPAIGAIANGHDNVEPGQWRDDPAKKRAELRKLLDACDRRQNPYEEFGNEWNMAALNTGKFADVYVSDWLKPLDQIRREDGRRVELLSMGIAGADTAFLEGLYANGGWPLLAGIAFHPGRGNFTPDYDGSGWTYLGTIRAMKATAAKFGGKPMWITEAYACTRPHDAWHDSRRRAAENVVLTYALGLAEGMKAVFFYQLHDAVWSDVRGINTEDSEYDYGLLDRSGAVKPSLLAYCAVAEALDGAGFRRYVTFPSGTAKGILFDTPRGPLAVLWDRTEGYIQSDMTKKPYASPEPWQEHWTRSVAARFPAARRQVTVVDCIGRTRRIAAEAGSVTLPLTGAPVMVYGLTLK